MARKSYIDIFDAIFIIFIDLKIDFFDQLKVFSVIRSRIVLLAADRNIEIGGIETSAES